MLRFMGSQRVGHDWATELNWTEKNLDDSNTYIKKNRMYLRFLPCKEKIIHIKLLVFYKGENIPRMVFVFLKKRLQVEI